MCCKYVYCKFVCCKCVCFKCVYCKFVCCKCVYCKCVFSKFALCRYCMSGCVFKRFLSLRSSVWPVSVHRRKCCIQNTNANPNTWRWRHGAWHDAIRSGVRCHVRPVAASLPHLLTPTNLSQVLKLRKPTEDIDEVMITIWLVWVVASHPLTANPLIYPLANMHHAPTTLSKILN